MQDVSVAKELVPLMRDRGAAAIQHPALTGMVADSAALIWNSTVQVKTPTGSGSGCLVRSPERNLAVTNAHVVDGHSDCHCSWTVGPFKRTSSARLVGIDYIHDLALVELSCSPDSTQQPLEVGQSPLPGEWVTVCGYPQARETPRLAQGIVSGYVALEPEGVPITSVVIQAPINQRNSGGPVCDQQGLLVGVIWSINPRFRHGIPRPQSKAARSAIAWVEQALVPIDGYGYALDPADVRAMLSSLEEASRYGRHEGTREPKHFEMARSDFVELQRQAVLVNTSQLAGASCVGIFNYSPQGQILLGWHGGVQLPLETPPA